MRSRSYIFDASQIAPNHEGRCEPDSHADTCVAGANCLLIEHTGRSVNVQGFSPDLPQLESVPIATVLTAYDCPRTARTYLLLINEALYMPDLPYTLLCPNQLRDFGLHVDERPRQYDEESIFGVHIPDAGLHIPFTLEGVTAGFQTRPPTMDEITDPTLVQYDITSPLNWDPTSPDFAIAEEAAGDGDVLMEDVDDDAKVKLKRQVAVMRRKENDEHIRNAIDVTRITQDLFELDIDRSELTTPGERNVSAIRMGEPQQEITPESVAAKWMIGTEAAKRTLQVTTQGGVRRIQNPALRRFKTQMTHLRYPRLPGIYYCDTMKATVKSLEGHQYAHVIGNGKGYSRMFPMVAKNETVYSLDDFVGYAGIPEELLNDNDPTMKGWKQWKQRIREYRIKPRFTEPYSPHQNRSELDVREVRRGVKKQSIRAKSPLRLWNYLGPLVCKIRSLTASSHPSLKGRNNFELVHGWTPDISPYVMHSWYEVVGYRDNDGETKLACWLGPAEGHGGGDAAWLLPESAKPIVRSTFWALTINERADKADQIKKLLDNINNKIGDDRSQEEVESEMGPIYQDIDIFLEDDADDTLAPAVDPDLRQPEADEYTTETFDRYLASEVLINRGGETIRGTVKSRRKDLNGIPVGKANDNPLLDTREYQVEFDDGSEETYTANLVAENIYSQVDSSGHRLVLLNEIIDHRKDGRALVGDDGFYTDHSGTRRPKRTTAGWKILVEWKHGTTDWLPLTDVKQSYPVELAEYAVQNKISTEPAFAWWVPHTLKKKERILAKLKTKHHVKTHKYGVEVPRSMKDAIALDEKTGTDFWRKAIDKELRNVFGAFDFLDDGKSVPPGYNFVETNMVFDVKLDLTRKARLVARGDKLDPPKTETFASVVSRDSVRLFFLLAALNDLDVLSCDIQNAYITAPNREKLWTKFGDEFGPQYQNKKAIVAKALYGLRSSGKSFRDFLAKHLREMGFTSSRADPDMWMRAVKRGEEKLYEYVICYVDDLAYAGLDAKGFMKALGQRFTLKEGSVKEPDQYLGANVKKVTIPNSDTPGKTRWAFESSSYTKKAIASVEVELHANGEQLKTKVKTPLSTGYRPEVDASPELNPKQQNYYQGLIGILRWIGELGRLDILMPVSMLSRYLISARRGHLEQVLHIFAYLKHHPKSTMVFDDTVPDFRNKRFQKHDWSELYPDAKEAIPHNMPEPRGKPVLVSCFVDADHAGCRATRRSHSGIIIFVNKAPILWYSKRQNTVEASTYGSELLAMRLAVEMIEGLRYKLRMLGVPLEEEACVFCDNNSVVMNVKPESALKKKHAAINWHRVREAIAASTIKVAKEHTSSNLADILTKPLPGPTLRELIGYILW